MYDFYKAKGYNVSFIMNTVNIEDREKYLSKNRSSNSIKVGLYSSGDRWVKNTYNQLSAVSLIENAELNCIPLNPKIRELASFLDLPISGTEQGVGREKLFEYMANNDINIYVTFTECAPLIPLESLDLGVPCITGDNHHYFEGTELEKYLVVNKEDNIIEIYEKIKFAIENKEKIIQLYKKWKTENEIRAKESNNNFIDIRNKGE